jgi:hypothetical protein
MWVDAIKLQSFFADKHVPSDRLSNVFTFFSSDKMSNSFQPISFRTRVRQQLSHRCFDGLR